MVPWSHHGSVVPHKRYLMAVLDRHILMDQIDAFLAPSQPIWLRAIAIPHSVRLSVRPSVRPSVC